MKVPVSTDPGPDKRYEGSNRVAYQAQAGSVLSMESQLRLRSLYDFIDERRATLDAIHTDLSFFKSSPLDPQPLRSAARRLGSFCMEADSWGFDSLHEIASRLQMLLLESGGWSSGGNYWDMLHRGLAMLSDLLDQCESDFRRRLAVSDMLETLDRALLNNLPQ